MVVKFYNARDNQRKAILWYLEFDAQYSYAISTLYEFSEYEFNDK
jgi:hypothetical protein